MEQKDGSFGREEKEPGGEGEGASDAIRPLKFDSSMLGLPFQEIPRSLQREKGDRSGQR